MAFTVSNITQNVTGKFRNTILRVTADAATGELALGLGVIQVAQYTVVNMNSAPTMNLPVIVQNAGVTGTAVVGSVSLTNCVSGGIYFLDILSGS